MSFNGNESSAITLAQGATLTANYRSNNPNGLKGHFFGKNKLISILNQEGGMGIRCYYGEDNNGNQQLVLVGADAHEDDMSSGVILDMSIPCPTLCGTANSLNSDE